MVPSVAFGFLCLAVIGLTFSLVIHALALLGLRLLQPFGDAPLFLFLGIFVVCPPACLLVRRMSMGVKVTQISKAMFGGCPRWMRLAAPTLFYYGVISAALFSWRDAQANGRLADIRALTPAQLRALSAFLVSFYTISATLLYSVWRVSRRGAERRCPNQHSVSQFATFCGECGAHIAE